MLLYLFVYFFLLFWSNHLNNAAASSKYFHLSDLRKIFFYKFRLFLCLVLFIIASGRITASGIKCARFSGNGIRC